jgi:hypothetical protein
MFNKRFDRLERTKKWPAAWSLLAILVFVFQPLGTSLFCHQDAAHDHASHEHPTATQHDNHSHSDASAQHKSHPHETLINTAHPPEHSGDSCCCQVESAPVVASVATSFTSPVSKFAAAPPQVAILSQVFSLEVAPAIQSRAGPPTPSVLSQLRRCSLLNRAPPLSA